MPHVKIDFLSDDSTVEVHFRPSVSILEEGAQEQRWGISREDGEEANDEDLAEWKDIPTGLPDTLLPLVVETLNAMLQDSTPYYIRLLYDREPDDEPPAVEPESLQTPRLVSAVQALLDDPNVSYR
jgi:hypothetical protein